MNIPGDVGKELPGERWPFKCMSNEQVIQERSVLFPDFIFLVN